MSSTMLVRLGVSSPWTSPLKDGNIPPQRRRRGRRWMVATKRGKRISSSSSPPSSTASTRMREQCFMQGGETIISTARGDCRGFVCLSSEVTVRTKKSREDRSTNNNSSNDVDDDDSILVPRQEISIHDVTESVRAAVHASGVSQGVVHLLSKHTTVGLMINESEARLERDFEKWLLGIAPKNSYYEHNDLHERPETQRDFDAIDRNWMSKGFGTLEEFLAQEPINAHAHLLASLIGTTLSIPVIDGNLATGQWQSILMVELDGPRDRTLVMQVMGGTKE